MSILLTDESSFWEHVVTHSRLVLLFFTDGKNHDTDSLHSHICTLALQYGFAMRFCKMNLSDASELLEKLDLQITPTFLLFRHGQVIDEYEGVPSLSELETFIENHW